MQLKDIIRKIQNTSLIQLFLDFTRKFQLQYEKISKEISFKCHQATWILASVKATGYGRTEMQAYNHALRNLLQLLIEDKTCYNFFFNAFKDIGIKINPQSRIPKKQQMKSQVKTETNQPNNQFQLKKTDSHSQLFIGNHIHNQNYRIQKDCTIVLKQSHQRLKQSQKVSLNSSFYTNTKKNSDSNPMVSSLKNQSVNKMQNNTSKNSFNCIYIDMEADKKSNVHKNSKKQQLLQAKQKLACLEKKLVSIQDQNQMLKIMIKKYESRDKVVTISHTSPNQSSKNIKSKVSIPKLKLQILPNYHKKCEKPLNQALLAMYNKTHQGKA